MHFYLSMKNMLQIYLFYILSSLEVPKIPFIFRFT